MPRVQLFGVPSPKILGGTEIADLGRAGQRLAGYLFSVAGRTLRREFLQDQFWGELGEGRARAALSTALWRIRKALPDGALLVRHSEITLLPDERLLIDVRLFSEQAENLLAEDAQATSPISALKACLALYLGQFLEGEAAEWAVIERERLERLYLRLLALFGNRLARTNQFEEAIVVANQILTIDPFREATHRDLIIALALNEQRAAAIHHFERLRRLLRDELDLAPARETAVLMDTLKSEVFRERLLPLKGQCFSGFELSSQC